MIRGGKVLANGRLLHEMAADTPKAFLEGVYAAEGISYPKFYKMDTLSQLGFLATEVLLGGSPLFGGPAAGGSPPGSGAPAPARGLPGVGGAAFAGAYGPEDVGLVLCNANASLDTDRRYFKTVSDMPSPALFVYTLPNIVIGEICIRHGFKGENAFFVFKEFDTTFIQQYVDGLLDEGAIQACICGWVDVLGATYDAALALVEKTGEQSFTADNLNKMYTWTS